MTPLTLFDEQPNPSPMVRASDPPTSKYAAKSVDVTAGRAKVHAALTDLGRATDQEIEQHPACRGMGRGSAIKRRLELERAGLVERCGVSFEGNRRLLVFRLVAAS
jgi:hypothetical protein